MDQISYLILNRKTININSLFQKVKDDKFIIKKNGTKEG